MMYSWCTLPLRLRMALRQKSPGYSCARLSAYGRISG